MGSVFESDRWTFFDLVELMVSSTRIGRWIIRVNLTERRTKSSRLVVIWRKSLIIEYPLVVAQSISSFGYCTGVDYATSASNPDNTPLAIFPCRGDDATPRNVIVHPGRSDRCDEVRGGSHHLECPRHDVPAYYHVQAGTDQDDIVKPPVKDRMRDRGGDHLLARSRVSRASVFPSAR